MAGQALAIVGTALLLAVTVMSGCLQNHATGCIEEPCVATLRSVPAPGVRDGTVVFESCTGGVAGLRVPFEWARGQVPPEFRVESFAPGIASLLMGVLECDRVAANATVFADVSMFHAMLFVTARNETWRAEGTHNFVLAQWFSSLDLATWLNARGVPSGTASFDHSDVPGGAARIEVWTVRGPECTFALNFQRAGEPGIAGKAAFYRWFGPKPFARVDAYQDYAYDQILDASLARAEGECPAAKTSGPATAYVAQALQRFDSTWILTEERFA